MSRSPSGGQLLARHRATPGIGARPSLGKDAPGQDETVLVLRPQLADGLEAVLFEQPIRRSSSASTYASAAPGPTYRSVPPGAEQQADRLREDGLAGAGLARDRVQTRRECELRLADEDEVLDAEPRSIGPFSRDQPANVCR